MGTSHSWSTSNTPSVMPRPNQPPSEKTRIGLLNKVLNFQRLVQNVIRTNEIVKSFITQHFPYSSKLLHLYSFIPVLFSSCVTKSVEHCYDTLPVQQKTFQGENFHEFHSFVAKVLTAKFGVWRPLPLQKRAICESFLCENRIFTNLRKFSLSKVFRYTVVSQGSCYASPKNFSVEGGIRPFGLQCELLFHMQCTLIAVYIHTMSCVLKGNVM